MAASRYLEELSFVEIASTPPREIPGVDAPVKDASEVQQYPQAHPDRGILISNSLLSLYFYFVLRTLLIPFEKVRYLKFLAIWL